MRTMMIAVIAIAGTFACSDDGSGGPVAPPEGAVGHTERIDGAFHRAGLRDPETSCVECHGEDLRGGFAGEPSCFTCHGQKW